MWKGTADGSSFLRQGSSLSRLLQEKVRIPVMPYYVYAITQIQGSTVFMDLFRITVTRKFANEKSKIPVIPKAILLLR
jgi:L-lysine 2,3-aminomutase